jgi:hypothetical protein
MSTQKLALTAFLSHKYKAPAVNEYFFQLFSRTATVEFEVDIGSLATNVTRLERLIRGTDAFIGIYPFDEGGLENPTAADLANAARYFRLELDIAARSRKPGLVFSDDRFRGIISSPPPIQQVPFNIQEVTGGGARPSSAKFVKAFGEFCRQVIASRDYGLTIEQTNAGNGVGVLLPQDGGELSYGREQVATVLSAIRVARFEPIEFPWPPVITPEWIRKIRGVDWVVLDIGQVSMQTGVVGYLHGEFKPAMRLLHVQDPATGTTGPATSPPLYSGFEVGYPKDIVRWWDSDSLLNGLSKRIESLEAPRKRISTIDGALEYFRSAALRKEAVFISYAGRDEDQASQLISAFRKQFQQVFDYRDGKSIRPGQPWIKEIFDKLAVSPIGVPLLSSAYIDSGNCLHELREMVARRDNGKMQLFPVKLGRTDKFDIPHELGETQYARLWEYASPEELVHWITTNIPKQELAHAI